MTTDKTCVMGIGSPIVDLLAQVDEKLIEIIPGEKGGMELVDSRAMAALLERITGKVVRAPGGSAANTTFLLARLGIPTRFLGKLGGDNNGRYYKKAFRRVGGDCDYFKMAPGKPTACCLSLITPDSERTMRTDLGAAMTLAPEEVSAQDFAGCSHAHVEGYLLFNRRLIERVLTCAREAGCTVSLDLASFEVVEGAKDILPELLADYVDIVFANEDEAKAYCGVSDPETGLDALADVCAVAAVKIGKEGAWVRKGGRKVRVAPVRASNVIDTTGAGDMWAAGFLFGYLKGQPIRTCGRYASVLGAAAVQEVGATIAETRWETVQAMLRGEKVTESTLERPVREAAANPTAPKKQNLLRRVIAKKRAKKPARDAKSK